MTFIRSPLSSNRINFRSGLSEDEIKQLVADSTLRVLQTDRPVDQATWRLLNDLFFPYRPDVEIRIYGYYSADCDLTFLHWLPNLVNLSIDCVMDASNAECIGELQNLQSLAIGIYSLDNFDFLQNIPSQSLTKLSLMTTRSKRPEISALSRFKNLRTLYIEGQQKGIESIAMLTQLEDLTLRSVSPDNLDFLKSLSQLWSLDIKLGGTTNLNALQGMSQIKYLELWQIRGLNDIDIISSLTGLQNLFLQSLKNITHIPNLSELHSLKRIYLENMKGLMDVSGLSTAPALQEFSYAMAGGMPTDYETLLRQPSLERASVWFGSSKKNDAFRDMASKNGIGEYKFYPFEYK